MEKISLKELLTKDIQGKIICFPTDTVYGVACLVNDEETQKRIFMLKNREFNKPLAILCPSREIDLYVAEIKPYARQLIAAEWPGALTLIFTKSSLINDTLTKGFSTVAFRMPNSSIALAILNKFGLLATTSVNISGQKEINDVDEIYQKFKDTIDYLVIDKADLSAKPSKIIDATGSEPKIIRS